MLSWTAHVRRITYDVDIEENPSENLEVVELMQPNVRRSIRWAAEHCGDAITKDGIYNSCSSVSVEHLNN